MKGDNFGLIAPICHGETGYRREREGWDRRGLNGTCDIRQSGRMCDIRQSEIGIRNDVVETYAELLLFIFQEHYDQRVCRPDSYWGDTPFIF